MEKVTITFIGHQSDEVAKRFYSWIIDGGMEDTIINTLSSNEIKVDGIADFNNDSLEIAISSTTQTSQKKTSPLPPAEDCNIALNANINGKEQPNKLRVHGSAMMLNADDNITITESSPQGINSRILLLDVSITSKSTTTSATCKHFYFEKIVDGKAYDQVTVRLGGGIEKTTAVHYFG